MANRDRALLVDCDVDAFIHGCVPTGMLATFFEILGTGCARCNQLHEVVLKAVTESGVSAEVRKVEDIALILKSGVERLIHLQAVSGPTILVVGGGFIATPALVLEGGLSTAAAIPVALGAIALGAASSLVVQIPSGTFRWSLVVPAVVAALAGMELGRGIARRVPAIWLRRGNGDAHLGTPGTKVERSNIDVIYI